MTWQNTTCKHNLQLLRTKSLVKQKVQEPGEDMCDGNNRSNSGRIAGSKADAAVNLLVATCQSLFTKLILKRSRIFLASIALLLSPAELPQRSTRFSRSEIKSKSDSARGRVEDMAKVTTWNSGVSHNHSLMSQLKD